MVELMEAIGSTFHSWRTRATKGVRWAWYRRSRTDSMTKTESPQNYIQRDSNPAPQHPPFIFSSTDQVNASDAEEDSPVPPLRPSAFDFIHTSQPSPNGRERHDGALQKHATTSAESKSETFGDAPQPDLLSLHGGFKDVSARRVRLRQSRMAMKYKRDEEVELRIQFMKHLNTFFADFDHPEAEGLRQDFERLQIATEGYLTMENQYRQEENILEEREYLLDLSMEGFTGPSEREAAPSLQPYTDSWSQISDEDSVRELPRCVSNYLSRIGDERMLQERLSELDSEWFMIIERQDMRDQFQLALDEDSREFLLTFDEQRAEVLKDLNNAQMDVNFLRVYCIEQGHRNFSYQDLSSLNTYQYDEQPNLELDMDPLKLSVDENFVYSPETADDHSEPIWEPPQLSPNVRFQFVQILQQAGSIGSSEFINKWMLHQLRISSMGIWYIHRIPRWRPLRESGLQDYDISQHVLAGWFLEDVALAPSSSDYYSSASYTVGLVHGRAERLRSPSLPSSPRTSAQKLRQRRHSRP